MKSEVFIVYELFGALIWVPVNPLPDVPDSEEHLFASVHPHLLSIDTVMHPIKQVEVTIIHVDLEILLTNELA